jgi:hypothetical protein
MYQQFVDIVEHGTVRTCAVDDGIQLCNVRAKRGEARVACLAFMALMFFLSVFISPLWAIILNGWARGQDGKVLVLYRWWTMAKGLAKSCLPRSG